MKNEWFKSTHSGADGACVEAKFGDSIELRDSKDPNGAVLSFNDAEWDAFLKGVRDGQFDRK